MSRLAKSMLALFLGITVCGGAAAGLTLVVEYAPYGVPEERREEYERKIALIKRQNELAGQREAQGPLADVHVDVSEHDFGLMDPHATASHSFEVRNRGDAPLLVSVAGTSCKCTVGELASSVVEPGDSTQVTLTWNTGYKADRYEQTATLRTNDPDQPTVEFRVRGRVKAELIAPERVAFPASDPGDFAETAFVVFSQLHDDFVIRHVESDLEGFQWTAEPVSIDAAELVDREAASAWRLTINAAGSGPGRFQGDLKLHAEPVSGGDAIERSVTLYGKVRAPVSFYSPDLHRYEGLDIGTLISDRDHTFHVLVRERGRAGRQLEVLDVEPAALRAALEPSGREGDYKLTFRIPEGTPNATFNVESNHGYVHVGDPDDPEFSHWFPVFAAVVAAE